MNKVYMVSDGSYSDYSVLGIYSTRELAERAREVLNAGNDIEEMELDAIPETPPGLLAWWVNMAENGDIKQGPHRQGPTDGHETRWRIQFGYADVAPTAFFTLWARDADHAIKIAADKRRGLMVTGEWQAVFAKETAEWKKSRK
jgi:hypothetical protein